MQTVAGPHVELCRARTVGTISSAGVFDGDCIQTGAAVSAGGQRIVAEIVPVDVDVRVMNGEWGTGKESRHGARRQTFDPWHFDAAAQRDGMAPIRVGRTVILIEVSLIEDLVVIGGGRRAVGIALAFAERVRQPRTPVVGKAFFDRQVEAVVLRFADVLDDPQVARKIGQAELLRNAAEIDPA